MNSFKIKSEILLFWILVSIFFELGITKTTYKIEANALNQNNNQTDSSSPSQTSWIKIIDEADFGEKAETEAVVFKDKLWVIGGNFQIGRCSKDVWCSLDGKKWFNKTKLNGFGCRYGHVSLVYKNMIWVMGGLGTEVSPRGPGRALSDVWNSKDGENWVKITNNAPDFLAGWVYDDRLWGWAKTGLFNSVDGINWRLVKKSLGFLVDSGSEDMIKGPPIVFADKIWWIVSETEIYNTVNGKDWAKVPIQTPFHNQEFRCVVFNNRIWSIGGGTAWGGGDVSDESWVKSNWSSSDGSTWKLEIASPPYSKRFDPAIIVFNNKMWLLGGRDGSDESFGDIWCSQ